MNKGFTLVELLAVIIILSLLAVLASTSITSVVRDSKNDLYKSQLASIKAAAEAWGADNPDKLPDSGQCKYLTIGDLKEYGLLDSKIINAKTSKELNDDMLIKISSNKTIQGNDNIIYEVDVDDVSSCTGAMSICFLTNDSKEEKGSIGSKYSCEVKSGTNYIFYLIGTNIDGTSNLIMESNIDENGNPITPQSSSNLNNVHWNETSSVDGPITAMTYIYNATKSWINISPINFTYKDREYQNIISEGIGYESIIATNGIATIKGINDNVTATIGTNDVPLRARMPIYAATYGDNYSIATEKGEIASLNSSNSYLYTNLSSGKIDGYWSISSFYDAAELGLYISAAGRGYEYPLNENGTIIGVRPVITVGL